MNRVTLIAECSSNHGGNIRLAHDFVDRFAEAGADIIKFQATRVRHLRLDDPQYHWFSQAELGWDTFASLKQRCKERGVHFLLTAQHPAEVPEIAKLGCRAIKVASPEAHNKALATAITAATPAFEKIFVSCGLFPPHALYRGATFLACCVRYPCSAGAAEIVGADAMYRGWSDHCVGLEGCRRAVERGVTVLEKHVCLKDQARDPKPWEATVEEFRSLRRWVDEDPFRFIGRWTRG